MVSVIVPSYNHAAYLKKRIDSVLNQTYTNFELIILDDCSTDCSKYIIDEYRENSKISCIIYNETNSGSPFIQWQKGFKLAKGEYIWIAESDDYADIFFLEKLISYFEKDKKIGIVYCDSHVIDAEEQLHENFCKIFKNIQFKTNKWSNNYQKNGYKEIEENLFYECTINNMSATLFRKNLITQINFEELKKFSYSGDWFFLIGLAKQCNVYYVCEALNYFKHGTNNFKINVKSTLNYLKETSRIKYLYWKDVSVYLTKTEQKKVFEQLGLHMQVIINETLKGEIKLKSFFNLIKHLYLISPQLLGKQLWFSFKYYLRKIRLIK